MPLQNLNFITGNRNKLVEVEAILGNIVNLRSQSLDLTEIQGTIEAISKDKCRRAAATVRSFFGFSIFLLRTVPILRHSKIGGPVLTEDTCLCFNALKELPGPYM